MIVIISLTPAFSVLFLRSVELALLPLTAFLLLLLVVAMWERRYTRPYLSIAPERAAATSPYVRKMNEDAAIAGFVFQSHCSQVDPAANIRGSVWRSPERTTLFVTGAGTIYKFQCKASYLYSQLADGTFLCTTDMAGAPDISSVLRLGLDWNGLFPGLWELHQRRMKRAVEVLVFGEGDAVGILNDLSELRARRMVELRLAKFVGPDEMTWRYTFLGAARIREGFFVQFARAARKFWRANSEGAGPAV